MTLPDDARVRIPECLNFTAQTQQANPKLLDCWKARLRIRHTIIIMVQTLQVLPVPGFFKEGHWSGGGYITVQIAFFLSSYVLDRCWMSIVVVELD